MSDVRPFKIRDTGAKERPTDNRDYLLGAAQVTEEIPAVFMQEVAWNLPILYQGKRPACGAHSGAALKMILDEYESPGRYYTPRYTWIDIKSFDGFPVETGTDMRSIMKSLKKSGALDFGLLGNDVTLDDLSYLDPKVVTREMREVAEPRGIGNYGFTNSPSFNQIKQSIFKNKAVILRLRTGEELYTAKNGKTSWAEKDILPLRPPTKAISGHFVVGHSYDENYIYFTNSFSERWGRKGHGYFGLDYMPHVLEMGSAADISDLIIPNLKKQVSLLQQLLELYKKLTNKS